MIIGLEEFEAYGLKKVKMEERGVMSELKPCPFCGKEQMTAAQRGDSNVPYTGGTRLCDTRGCNCVSRNWNNRPIEDALRAENARLRAALESLRSEGHYECEDSWYSCPKHPEYVGNDDRNNCTCGTDATNAIIDAALKGE